MQILHGIVNVVSGQFCIICGFVINLMYVSSYIILSACDAVCVCVYAYLLRIVYMYLFILRYLAVYNKTFLAFNG